jgi:type IV pilus assembly protein PilQ
MNGEQRILFRLAIAVCLFAVFWPLPSSTGQAQDEIIRYLNLDQADVKSVLRYLAEISEMNIVADHDVEGEISLNLKNVTWRQALEALLSSQELTAQESDGFIRVMTMETFYAERLEEYNQTKQQQDLMALERLIIRVENAKAEDIQKSVERLLTDRGKIAIDQRTNSLVVTDVPTKLSVIKETIEMLDTATPQITIETKLVELNNRRLREMGIDWTALTSTGDIIEYLGGRAVLDTTGILNVAYGTLGTVVDNKEGYIFMGERVPLTTVDFSGNVIVRLEEVGTQLAVTPHITVANEILLELRPERSAVTEVVPGVGYRMSTQRAETEVLVRDGETAIIGGLRSTEQTTLDKGVPIMKDIPLIGRLFKYTREEMTEKDLIIFVTPTIVKR